MSMQARPAPPPSAPLVPAACVLQDYRRMPVDVVRLGGSRFNAMTDDSAWRCGVTLWFASWHQTPAGTLPNADDELMTLCGLGRGSGEMWRRIRDAALHGWILCEDGRLHHPTIAEIALEAWLSKLTHRLSSAMGNAKRWGAGVDVAFLLRDLRDGVSALEAVNPQSPGLPKARKVLDRLSPSSPDGDGSATGSRRDRDGTRSASRRDADGTGKGSGRDPVATEFRSQEKGEGEERVKSGEADASPSLPRDRADEGEGTWSVVFLALLAAYPERRGRGSPVAARMAFDRLPADVRLALPAAAKAYAEAAGWGSKGPPALARWLGEEFWRPFLADRSSVTSIVWAGPPELRAAVAAEHGEPFARSYLDPAEWVPDGPGGRPSVIPLSDTAAVKLGGCAALEGVTIGLPRRRQA